MMMLRMFIVAAGLLVATAASAGEIYKCPNAAGKVEFRDTPCPTAAGTKIVVQPNSVQVQDQSELRAKREAVEKRLAAMEAADIAENNRRARAQQARIDRCQSYLDNADRQRAWLQSISPAAAQSAANEIAIQGRKYSELRCDEVMR
jgi:hypothetical protein